MEKHNGSEIFSETSFLTSIKYIISLFFAIKNQYSILLTRIQLFMNGYHSDFQDEEQVKRIPGDQSKIVQKQIALAFLLLFKTNSSNFCYNP